MRADHSLSSHSKLDVLEKLRDHYEDLKKTAVNQNTREIIQNNKMHKESRYVPGAESVIFSRRLLVAERDSGMNGQLVQNHRNLHLCRATNTEYVWPGKRV